MRTGLTTSEISRSSQRMARPKNEFEKVLLRLIPETKARIAAVLQDDEDHAHFMRSAIEAELKRRERSSRKPNDKREG